MSGVDKSYFVNWYYISLQQKISGFKSCSSFSYCLFPHDYAPIVQWTEQSASTRLMSVRVVLGAQKVSCVVSFVLNLEYKHIKTRLHYWCNGSTIGCLPFGGGSIPPWCALTLSSNGKDSCFSSKQSEFNSLQGHTSQVAQKTVTSQFRCRDCRFESYFPHIWGNGLIGKGAKQSVLACTPMIYTRLAQRPEQLLYTERAVGSNPTSCTWVYFKSRKLSLYLSNPGALPGTRTEDYKGNGTPLVLKTGVLRGVLVRIQCLPQAL